MKYGIFQQLSVNGRQGMCMKSFSRAFTRHFCCNTQRFSATAFLIRSNSTFLEMKTTLFFGLIISVFIICALGDLTMIENTCNCGPNDRCCQDATLGAVCYNPATHLCADNRKLCGKDEGVCLNQCYSRKTHRCLTSSQGCKLCNVYDALCGLTCYNPNLYR